MKNNAKFKGARVLIRGWDEATARKIMMKEMLAEQRGMPFDPITGLTEGTHYGRPTGMFSSEIILRNNGFIEKKALFENYANNHNSQYLMNFM